ncbi:hypothetical protein [Pedobacter frigiditerrae]|uniref:hypothetical protein n=1 Tax=Pedobacter frigiditerrae TaxID=2530452 RepID=UPI0029317828|nr:hypothetical protein [Pedobacter frigiditerrae]
MKRISLLLITSIVVFAACNSSTPKEEKPKPGIYTSLEVGWTIKIPQGFQSLSKSRIEANMQKGKEALNKVAEGKVETDGAINLVNFQKNQFNSLFALIESCEDQERFLRNNQKVRKLIFDTYTNQEIKVDTLSGREEIAGQTFNTFYIKIYGPSGEVLMNQIMFNQFIRGYDFGVNINYNNETDKQTLLNAFKNSTFDK